MLGKMQLNLLFSELIRTFDLRSKVLTLGKAKNLRFFLLSARLIVILTSSKVLTLGKENKKGFLFCFPLA